MVHFMQNTRGMTYIHERFGFEIEDINQWKRANDWRDAIKFLYELHELLPASLRFEAPGHAFEEEDTGAGVLEFVLMPMAQFVITFEEDGTRPWHFISTEGGIISGALNHLDSIKIIAALIEQECSECSEPSEPSIWSDTFVSDED